MSPPLGATLMDRGGCHFRVWAPNAKKVEVHLLGSQERFAPMKVEQRGYHRTVLSKVAGGTLYRYRLDGKQERPDPASHFQPDGVHGPSQVVSRIFEWTDQAWKGVALEDYILYELHVGTFTRQGTFGAAIGRLDELADLGVTALELMPVAQFPGSRNWGYDGAYPFAVQNSYGGPEELRRFVNACHRRRLAVVLDVIYNHLGPEGNYLACFGPYFTDRYRTPWGPAVNYDGARSAEVRRYFIENALYWIRDFHIDAFRLDAIHAIVDTSARPFLEELGVAIHRAARRLGRHIYVIPESDLNDTRIIRRRNHGGFGLDAQWRDDLHHALHTLLTGERNGYYRDFGTVSCLAKAFKEEFVYSGLDSEDRRRRHRNSSRALPGYRFVVFAQNHDQVGNRLRGDRLSEIVSFEDLKLAASVVIFAPSIPLLFMGEEYGETSPFLYFVSHADKALAESVRRGRKKEFAGSGWRGDPADPLAEQTFKRSKVNSQLRRNGRHKALYGFTRQLIRLRKELPPTARFEKRNLEVISFESQKILWVRRTRISGQPITIWNFGERANTLTLPFPRQRFRKVLDSEDACWGGRGNSLCDGANASKTEPFTIGPKSFLLLQTS